jgi:hypothetical protein
MLAYLRAFELPFVLMNLLKEMKEHGVELPTTKPTVYCKLFEDNAGAIHIAKSPKTRPRTCHIN